MGRRCCCVPLTCELDSDDFDRDDSDDVGSKWIEVSGDFDISDNTLVCVTPGVLACTKCHPAGYDRGSFTAFFDLINPSDGKVYKVRAGNPTSSTLEVHWTVVGTGVTRELTVDVIGDGADGTVSWTFDYPEGFNGNVVEVVVCYMPGVELTALCNLEITRVSSAPISDAASTCYSGKGNFSFLEGDFDNWVYQVHWMENHDCTYCDCFCYLGGSPEQLVGLPTELTMTITNIRQCTRMAGTYTLYQRNSNMGTYAGGFITDDWWPEKQEWWSDVIDMYGSPACCWRLGVFCTINEETNRLLWAMGFYRCGIGSGDLLWADDAEHPPWSTDNNWAYATADSTCDPFYLHFPFLLSGVEQCCEGDGDFYNQQPYVEIEVTV
jgi:hypothetical protein